MTDSLRHKGLRQKLVNTLRQKGINSEQVLAAIGAVPRHFFLDSGIDPMVVYRDIAVPIDADQTISQPFTVAKQTELLNVQSGEKILEIGTGSGYQAAVLCAMGADLYSIERHQILHIKAKNTLAQMGFNPTLIFGDGFEGLPNEAPFSKIIVTCGASEVPHTLLEQLSIGGRIVIPISSNGELQMFTFDRLNEVDFKPAKHGNCAFVPMLKGVEN